MTAEELRWRFLYHPPKDELVAKAHEAIRSALLEVAQRIAELCPESRERSLAMTKLEEAMMWANAAIARHQVDVLGL